ncbi:uncharacterized protein LOC111622179 [Centruroides sculpturatus]|uniref:uncharacterized protein LOC111622179 n=1 Tax=Centruroides sculpturatus TaxID=218467 RepID=UPI000C6DFB8D|nr:uncharacterized protein LOC111622179 [Centruroides sculpturatus]
MLSAANHLGSSRTLQFSWIPSHSGIKGNETADKLAKMGSRSSCHYSFDRIPQSTLKNRLRAFAEALWQQEWSSANTGRNCFEFIPNILTRKNAKHYTPEADTSQILTGHGNFPVYLHRFGKANNSNCTCSTQSIGDALHLAFHCPNFDHLRLGLITNCLKKGLTWPPEPADLFQDRELWKDFTNFLSRTKALISYPQQNASVPEEHFSGRTESSATDQTLSLTDTFA